MAELDLTMTQGKTFRWIVTVTDSKGVRVNLTSKTVRGMIRRTYPDAAEIESFDIIYADQNDPELVGDVTVYLGATTTATIPARDYVYDLEIAEDNNPDEVAELYRGAVTMNPEATKP